MDIFISVFLALVIRPCLHFTILQRRRWCSSSNLLWIRGHNNTLTHSSSSTLFPNTTEPRALSSICCHYYGTDRSTALYTQICTSSSSAHTYTLSQRHQHQQSRGSHLNLATHIGRPMGPSSSSSNPAGFEMHFSDPVRDRFRSTRSQSHSRKFRAPLAPLFDRVRTLG